MLDILFLTWFAKVYHFYRKRTQRKGLAALYYFLTIGGIWALVMSMIGLLMTAEDLIKGTLVNPYFYLSVPAIGFILGDIFAFFPWLIALRSKKDQKSEP